MADCGVPRRGDFLVETRRSQLFTQPLPQEGHFEVKAKDVLEGTLCEGDFYRMGVNMCPSTGNLPPPKDEQISVYLAARTNTLRRRMVRSGTHAGRNCSILWPRQKEFHKGFRFRAHLQDMWDKRPHGRNKVKHIKDPRMRLCSLCASNRVARTSHLTRYSGSLIRLHHQRHWLIGPLTLSVLHFRPQVIWYRSHISQERHTPYHYLCFRWELRASLLAAPVAMLQRLCTIPSTVKDLQGLLCKLYSAETQYCLYLLLTCIRRTQYEDPYWLHYPRLPVQKETLLEVLWSYPGSSKHLSGLSALVPFYGVLISTTTLCSGICHEPLTVSQHESTSNINWSKNQPSKV